MVKKLKFEKLLLKERILITGHTGTQIKKHSNESAIPTIKVMNIGPLTSFRRVPLSSIKFDYFDLHTLNLKGN